MPDRNESSHMSTRLTFPPHMQVSESQLNLYQKLHAKLPKMKKNQVNIHGAEIKKIDHDRLIVTAFIRNTVEKPLRLKPSVIVLLDEQMRPFAKVEVDFTDLGRLSPNTASPWLIEFPKESFLQQDMERLNQWSIGFEKDFRHRLDYSDMNEAIIAQNTKEHLEKIIQNAPLDENEISLMGLTAKFDDAKNLVTTLLLRNGTNQNFDIKQLPLKFFDAQGDLSAQGTFRLEGLTLLANTSKPIQLVFPSSSILKPNMDLSKWSIKHNE